MFAYISHNTVFSIRYISCYHFELNISILFKLDERIALKLILFMLCICIEFVQWNYSENCILIFQNSIMNEKHLKWVLVHDRLMDDFSSISSRSIFHCFWVCVCVPRTVFLLLFFFETLPIGIFKYFFSRCLSLSRVFFRHSIKFCIPNRRKIDGTWSLLYEKPGKLSRSTFKCRRMFTVEALWKQGQRRKLIKHRHEVSAVQRFYENASADRSRSGALLMIPQSFINSIRLINVLV